MVQGLWHMAKKGARDTGRGPGPESATDPDVFMVCGGCASVLLESKASISLRAKHTKQTLDSHGCHHILTVCS